ncbi:hypothetical protein BTS2_1570 [Bacillus sp. TS-2]|nr:hypothetical protein BTS2_1570 [Bacillus sp. TS-2]
MFTVEFKKLLQPILLLVALLVTIVFYNQDLKFIHTYWPNGGLIPIYEHASDWQNRYGNSLEEKDIVEIEAEYFSLIKEADKIVSEHSIAKQLEFGNYAEFETWSQENLSGGAENEMTEEQTENVKIREVIQLDLVDDAGHSIVNKIEVLENLYDSMNQFDSPEIFLNNDHYNERERERLSEILFIGENWRNIFPTELSSAVASHFGSIITLLIFLLSLLIPSVLVRDRLLGIQNTQWSSRHGRRILWTQFASGVTASFLLITCILGIFGGLLYFTDFTRYFSNGLNSFFIGSDEPLLLSLFQWTFGQWLMGLVLLVYLIGMAYSGILIFLSQTSKHYLSLLMKIIPVGFVFIAITNQVLADAFYLKNELYQWTKIPMIELFSGILLLIIGISLPIIFCARQQHQDLLN